MISTIKEAHKRKMNIVREVRFHAYDDRGVWYALQHDWTQEIVDRELIAKALQQPGDKT